MKRGAADQTHGTGSVRLAAGLAFGLLLAAGGFSAAALARWPHANSVPETPQASSPSVGHIAGRVLFEGTPIPKPTEIANGTDPEACGDRQSFNDLLISPQNRGIQNVIVSLGDTSFPS